MPMTDDELRQLGFSKLCAFGIPGGYGDIWTIQNEGIDGPAHWSLTLFARDENATVGRG